MSAATKTSASAKTVPTPEMTAPTAMTYAASRLGAFNPAAAQLGAFNPAASQLGAFNPTTLIASASAVVAYAVAVPRPPSAPEKW